jgi:hypothetical protein
MQLPNKSKDPRTIKKITWVAVVVILLSLVVVGRRLL